MRPDTSPNVVQGSLVVVSAMFLGYTFLSVLGIVLVKRWVPEARQSLTVGNLSALPVWLAAAGAVAYGVSFLLWMGVVTKAPLSLAYPLAVGTTLCLTLVASFVFFHERPTSLQLVGSALVLLGITFIGTGLRN